MDYGSGKSPMDERVESFIICMDPGLKTKSGSALKEQQDPDPLPRNYSIQILSQGTPGSSSAPKEQEDPDPLPRINQIQTRKSDY